MEKTLKKVARNFRLPAEINDELKRRSELTGVSETRLIEDALELWFSGAQQEQMKKMATELSLKKAKHGKKKMVRDTGFEPVTPTVSKADKAQKNPLYTISFGQKALLPANPADNEKYDLLPLSKVKAVRKHSGGRC